MKLNHLYFVRYTLASLFLASALIAHAAPIDDARRLIEAGQNEEAVTALRKIVKSKPRDPAANYLLGLALIGTGADAEGIKYLSTAESRGSVEASELLARRAFENYEPEEAQEHLDSWESSASKARKQLPASYGELASRVVAMDNMLRRVEKIEIIDTLRVDSTRFFTAYRLSREAGSLVPGEALGRDSKASVVFIPERRTEMIWAAPDSMGHSSLFSSAILDDGTVEHPERAELGGTGNASYPFLMSDGVTLYYAADKGPEGLGDYDIYMTRRSDDGGFMQSQNMGMPYNSPYNDFMLAIDETTGLGWWASDREQIPGKVTIYIFAPSETRVNYSPDTENLPSLARLDDIALTRVADKDYKAEMQQRLDRMADSAASYSASPSFELDMGAGGLYTSLNDFRDENARRTMLRYLADEKQLQKNLEKLSNLREAYSKKASGTLREQILRLESEVAQARTALRTTLNNAIRQETTHR
ncbi:MAG: hypothetical protein K2L96_04790 [Muribaculaceae bacterium]|nr:hypothetical protein [Muribaculaceae bacterium]